MQQIKSVKNALSRAYTSTRRVRDENGVFGEVTSYSLRTSDAAAIIREVLGREFPAARFYVRSQTYAGGSSIDVYFDGKAPNAPTTEQVREIASAFETKGFDGMIDMAYSKYRWLCPDGIVRGLVSSGTEDSRGVHPSTDENKPQPEAVLMTGGVDYVFEHASLPYDIQEKLEKKVA